MWLFEWQGISMEKTFITQDHYESALNQESLADAVMKYNINKKSNILLICDHANNKIPQEMEHLGLADYQLGRSLAWDIGAWKVAKELSDRLSAPLIGSGYSRLVIDCNRPLDAIDCIPSQTEGVCIPGNINLNNAQREQRIEQIYWPYHRAIKEKIISMQNIFAHINLISIHSFTRVMQGIERPWHIGITYNSESRLSHLLLKHLNRQAAGKLCIGDNQPYPVSRSSDASIPMHGEDNGIPNVLIEIRQDQIVNAKSAQLIIDSIHKGIQSTMRSMADR